MSRTKTTKTATANTTTTVKVNNNLDLANVSDLEASRKPYFDKQKKIGKELSKIENDMLALADDKKLTKAMLDRFNSLFDKLYHIAYTHLPDYKKDPDYNQTFGAMLEVMVWIFAWNSKIEQDEWYDKWFNTAKEYYKIPYQLVLDEVLAENKK